MQELKRIRLIIGIVFIAILLSCNSKEYSTTRSKIIDSSNSIGDLNRSNSEMNDTISECMEFLQDYHSYWIHDSVAKFGFRQLFTTQILSNCNFQGSKWSDIENLFGRPNFKFMNDSTTIYKYRASYYIYPEDHSAPGNLFVQFEVKNNIIAHYAVYEIDG